MKRNNILLSTIFVFIAMMTGGCVQHDGYIGNWFGSWYLEEMLINGDVDQAYEEAINREPVSSRRAIMVSFQGNIFNMAYINGSEIYGTWSYAGEILTLVANYNAGGGSVSPYFNPYPIELHFPADEAQLEITVTEINGKTMQWQYIDQNGNLITYNFRKYP